MTAPEAAAHFKINLEGLYARARRHGWKLVPGRLRNRQKKAGMKFDWGAKGDEHREAAFEVATKSVKLFKPRAPKSFKDLEIADRIARRSAGLETAEVVNQTLVHINEAIEDHGDAQVIEATEVGNNEQGDQAAPIEDAIVVDNEDTVAALPAPTD